MSKVCEAKCDIVLSRPTYRVTISYVFALSQAANAIQGGLSAFDCHNEIEPEVAYLMGFYQAKHELNHCGVPTAVGMILEDISVCLNHMMVNHNES